MAPHVELVVGVDVAQRMIDEARINLKLMDVNNATVEFGNDLSQVDGQFAWINSYIVFQHIPQSRGYAILQQMLDRLQPGGVLTVHFTIATETALIGKKILGSKYVVAEGDNIRVIRHPGSVDDREMVMSMHDYDLSRIILMLAEAGIERTQLRHTGHRGHHGVMVVGVKKLP